MRILIKINLVHHNKLKIIIFYYIILNCEFFIFNIKLNIINIISFKSMLYFDLLYKNKYKKLLKYKYIIY